MTISEGELPAGMESRVDKATDLILECMDMNKISKSEGVSTMASLLVSILSQYKDDAHFKAVIKLMQEAFYESRKEL